ncbi:MAG: hypothetical protein AAFU80_16745 [Pseudomonadota bacterium]
MQGTIRRVAQAAAIAVALGAAAPASAVTVNFDSDDQPDFFDGFLNPGDQATDGGVTVTFSNIVPSNGNGQNRARVDDDGLFFGTRTNRAYAVSFDLAFSRDVIITGYDIDFERSRGAAFVISGANGVSGSNTFSQTGNFAFDMGTIPVFLAGETYTLTHTGLTGNELSQIDEFEVEFVQPIPLPAALPALAVAFGALALFRRRRA